MKNIYDIILQYSTRGIEKIKEKYPQNEYEKASALIKKSKKGVVFLYTGFYVDGSAETDGPIGSYFLAQALRKLGFPPIIITDKYCKNFFLDIKTLYIPINENNKKLYIDLLRSYNPVLHISCERCGQNREKEYLNHRFKSITAYTADIDELFTLGSLTAPSIAIGDGGNEIGMGNFTDHFKDVKFHSIVKCDIPLIASVSNWGAYALISLLDKKLLPTFEEVDKYIEHILKKGAIDGITKKPEKSVDAKDWKIEKEILKSLRGDFI
jgi:hypothetical protein